MLPLTCSSEVSDNSRESRDLCLPPIVFAVPPKISDTQRKVIVKRGERAKIWCETVGVPTPQLRWHRDNVTVPKGFRALIRSFNPLFVAENLVVDEDDALRLALMFDNIQPENAGVYTCEGSSWVGSDSKDFDLVVLSGFFLISFFSSSLLAFLCDHSRPILLITSPAFSLQSRRSSRRNESTSTPPSPTTTFLCRATRRASPSRSLRGSRCRTWT